MSKSIDLMNIDQVSVHEIKKNIPNMELFLENISADLEVCNEGNSVSFMRLDLAHFKQVNDKYGYDVGDSVIVEFFKIINNRVNMVDSFIGRVGGDEFVVFIRGDLKKICSISDRVVDDIRSFVFKTIGCQHQHWYLDY
ncbi:GGDEF domain-containing protein [Mycoplasmatota bacterium zrk1]